MSVTAGLSRSVGSGRGSRVSWQPGLVEVVEVEVRVAEGVDEVADLQVADLRDQVGEQRVRGDVEGHAEEDVGRRW